MISILIDSQLWITSSKFATAGDTQARNKVRLLPPRAFYVCNQLRTDLQSTILTPAESLSEYYFCKAHVPKVKGGSVRNFCSWDSLFDTYQSLRESIYDTSQVQETSVYWYPLLWKKIKLMKRCILLKLTLLPPFFEFLQLQYALIAHFQRDQRMLFLKWLYQLRQKYNIRIRQSSSCCTSKFICLRWLFIINWCVYTNNFKNRVGATRNLTNTHVTHFTEWLSTNRIHICCPSNTINRPLLKMLRNSNLV